MSKLVLYILILIIGTCNFAYCASIGDPVEPLGDKEFALSVEQNLIFSREIEYGSFLQADIKDAYQWYGKGTYGIGEYFNIYAKAGISDLEHKFRDSQGDFDIEYDLGPLWGIGVLGVTPRWHGLNLGMDLQYAGWYVEVESLKFEQDRSADEIGEVLVTEYQATLFVSHKIEIPESTASLVPFVGLSYLYLNNETKETIVYQTPRRSGSIDFDLDNSRDWHFLIGADFVAGENVRLTIEGTLVYDNRGFMGSYSYKF